MKHASKIKTFKLGNLKINNVSVKDNVLYAELVEKLEGGKTSTRYVSADDKEWEDADKRQILYKFLEHNQKQESWKGNQVIIKELQNNRRILRTEARSQFVPHIVNGTITGIYSAQVTTDPDGLSCVRYDMEKRNPMGIDVVALQKSEFFQTSHNEHHLYEFYKKNRQKHEQVFKADHAYEIWLRDCQDNCAEPIEPHGLKRKDAGVELANKTQRLEEVDTKQPEPSLSQEQQNYDEFVSLYGQDLLALQAVQQPNRENVATQMSYDELYSFAEKMIAENKQLKDELDYLKSNDANAVNISTMARHMEEESRGIVCFFFNNVCFSCYTQSNNMRTNPSTIERAI